MLDVVERDYRPRHDVDLQAYFDNIQHHLLLAKVAQRVNDPRCSMC